MTEITINEALVLQKVARERLNDLKTLRNTVANKETFFFAREEKKVVEPQYDVKVVDRKMTQLQLFLLKSDTAINLHARQSQPARTHTLVVERFEAARHSHTVVGCH